MKKLLFVVCILAALAPSAIAEEKPFSAMGLTLGDSKNSVLAKFKSKKIDCYMIDNDVYSCDRPLSGADCESFDVVFFNESLMGFNCYVPFSKFGNTQKFFELETILSRKYGDFTDNKVIPEHVYTNGKLDHQMLSAAVVMRTAKLEDIWKIGDSGISLTIPNTPDDAENPYQVEAPVIYYYNVPLMLKWLETVNNSTDSDY